MTKFWNLEKFKDKIAIITNQGEKVSYQKLISQSRLIEIELKKNPNSLIFCKCRNNLKSIVNYIAILRSNCTVLLIDYFINDNDYNDLLDIYKPNFVLDESLVKLKNQTYCYDKLAVLLSTSGSTGNPKLVRLSKNNIQDNAVSIAKYLNITSLDRPVTVLQFHYSYGLSVINSHLLVGATILLTEESIISNKFWDFIKKEKVTSMAGVPYTFEMLKKLRFNNMNIPSLRYLTQAGGKLSLKLAEYFTTMCIQKNIDFFIMYGQTEASPRMSYFKTNNLLNKLSSIGKPIPGGEFYIYDRNNIKIDKIEKEGELVYKGSNVMLGYAENIADLKKHDELNRILYTGDLAKVDKDGFYYIIGRKNRFTKIHGLRINLDDISDFLLLNGISSVVVSDDNLILLAVVSTKIEKVQTMVLKKYKLHHSVLRIITINKIPKNKSGKILYNKINSFLN